MPTLNWIGKEKVINHHRDVPFKILEHKYGFNDTDGESKEPVNSGNKIIHGDNLEALKSLLPEYEGKIKCIYIDPPYNTGNENWVYNDNVNHPKIKKWLEATLKAKESGKEAAIGIDDLARHDKWLCMMYPRLKLLQKLLADNGAIFISIDDNELAHLKLIMDEIFGANNFIEYFSWKKSETPANLSFKSKKALEYIVCYQKKKNNTKFIGLQKKSSSDNPLIKPENSNKILNFKKEWVLTNFKKDIKIKKGLYGTDNNKVELLNDVEIINGTFSNDFSLKANFIWVQEKLEQEIAAGTEIRIKTKTLVPSYEKQNYDPEVPWNIIDSTFGVGTTQEGGDILKEIFGEKVFDFPKTPTLIQYLINFVCDTNSIILDSFAGSGTTAHAVLNLNKQDGGNRKFILVEMEDYANTITAERVKRVINGYGNKEGTGGNFDYYELGKPLFVGENNEYLNEEVDTQKIREYIWYSETRKAFEQPKTKSDTPYFLGKKEGTAYYFIYEKESLTTLDYDTLSTIKTKAGQYVIYADNCLLPKDFMMKKNIVFKKIPRDVTRF